VNICRADKFLIGSGAALLGSGAVFGAPLGIAIPAMAFAGIMLDGIFRPGSSTFYPTITRGSRQHPRVALTFDDGPDPEVTPAVLDALATANARGTFFAIGRYLERYGNLAQRIADEHHELGNHSWQHSYFQNFYGRSKHEADLVRSTRIIQQLTGSDRQPLYRPPVGLKSPALARVATAHKLDIVAWSLHSRDTVIRDPQRIAAQLLRRIQAGDIVLLHDGHDREGQHRRRIVEALPLILRGLKERGLEPVTVSEMLKC